MTVSSSTKTDLASRLVKGALAIAPLANFARTRARKMTIARAESIGVSWRKNVALLEQYDWDEVWHQIYNPDLEYPSYYTTSFHAYSSGNLSWQAAWEVESAAISVHAKIWSEGDLNGDALLRQSYSRVLQQSAIAPQAILDLGCGVGMSTLALRDIYPHAQLTGLDLSPYFLSVAQYRERLTDQNNIAWVHAAAESTGLSDRSFDLISTSLMFHELPAAIAKAIILEARRLLRPGGYLAIMDMNPRSEVFERMPPYVFTLFKSTEPYLDQYLSLDLEQAFIEAGFSRPTVTANSPRHKTIVAQIGQRYSQKSLFSI